MNRNFLILFFAFLTSGLVNAQVNLLNAKSVDQIGKESLQQLVKLKKHIQILFLHQK